MNPRKRIVLLISIMSILVVTTLMLSIGILYRTAVKEKMTRLSETAKSQARLIEAVARFDKKYSADYPSGAKQATLDQIKEARSKYEGFGITGEFTLAEKTNEQIGDDGGYWNKVEDYIKERSDVDFIHGVCPVCFKEHYPEEYKSFQNKQTYKAPQA